MSGDGAPVPAQPELDAGLFLLIVTDRAGNVTVAEGDGLVTLGLEAEQLLGRPLPVEAAPMLQAGCATALRGETQIARRDVGARRLELHFQPRRDASGKPNGSIALGLDVTSRRSAEERLAVSERRLADAQRLAHVGSWEWDVASDAVCWSDEMHRICGFAPGTFGGTYEAYFACVHPDDRQLAQEVVMESYRTSRPFEYDHRIVRTDGAVRMIHTRGSVVADDRGRAVRLVGSCWDITDKWEAEHRLESSLSLLRATIESTADGLLVVDRNGTVTAYNQRLLELWAVPRAAIEQASFERLLAQVHDEIENADECMMHVRQMNEQPEAESFDAIRFHDGRCYERYSRPQRVGGEIVGRVWSYRDVTERERLLRKAEFLADASRLLASLDVESALEAVARRALQGLAVYCAVDLFAGEGGPRRLVALSRDPDRPISAQLPAMVLRGGEAVIRSEGAISFVVVPVLARGDVVGALTFGVPEQRRHGAADLTLVQELAQRVALSIENARLHRHAAEALAARDEFLAIAAHEIRGPITSIHLAVQTLKRPETPVDARFKLLELLERDDRRLSRFVDELLDVARARTGGLFFTLEKVDLADVTREVVARMAPEVTRARSTVAVRTPGEVVGIWDRSRLEQVVTNLLGNAIKFGLGEPIDVEVACADGTATLTVRDHGLGIPVDRQQRIFEPFERAVSTRHYGGLGLGLYIVRRIVEELGGTIGVQSTPGAGSTFTVRLPQDGARACQAGS